MVVLLVVLVLLVLLVCTVNLRVIVRGGHTHHQCVCLCVC